MSEDGRQYEDRLGVRLRQWWGRLRERWWARWAIDLGILGLVFWGITAYQSRNLVESGRQIPEIHLQTAEGESEPMVDPEAGRTLLYLWAPWCGVCSAENGTVQWARSILGEDVAVRSIVFDYRDLEHVRQSIDEKGIDFPVLLGNRRVRDQFNVGAFPTFYVLSSDGRVVGSSVGYTTTLGLLYRSWF